MNEPLDGIKPLRVVIVDDHPLVRDGMVARIEKQPDLEVCGEAEDIEDALTLILREQPDVAVVDISLKTGNGINLIKQLQIQCPNVRTIVSSMHDDRLYAERAMRAGAKGYINKQRSGRNIVDAIRQVEAGNSYFSDEIMQIVIQRAATGTSAAQSPLEELSNRELEVYELIAQGCDMHEVAQRLSLSRRTAETYRDRIRAKLDLSSSSELTRHATQWYLEQ